MKQISLRLPDDLADRLTVALGDVPQNTWIIRAIEERLATVPTRESAEAWQLPPSARPRPKGHDSLGKGYVKPRPKGGKA